MDLKVGDKFRFNLHKGFNKLMYVRAVVDNFIVYRYWETGWEYGMEHISYFESFMENGKLFVK